MEHMSKHERLGWAGVSRGNGEGYKEIDEFADPALNPEEALIAKEEGEEEQEEEEA